MFQLAVTANTLAEIHPMAFEFPTRHPDKLFFPTNHVHDGALHDKAVFTPRSMPRASRRRGECG